MYRHKATCFNITYVNIIQPKLQLQLYTNVLLWLLHDRGSHSKTSTTTVTNTTPNSMVQFNSVVSESPTHDGMQKMAYAHVEVYCGSKQHICIAHAHCSRIYKVRRRKSYLLQASHIVTKFLHDKNLKFWRGLKCAASCYIEWMHHVP